MPHLPLSPHCGPEAGPGPVVCPHVPFVLPGLKTPLLYFSFPFSCSRDMPALNSPVSQCFLPSFVPAPATNMERGLEEKDHKGEGPYFSGTCSECPMLWIGSCAGGGDSGSRSWQGRKNKRASRKDRFQTGAAASCAVCSRPREDFRFRTFLS